MLRIKSLISLFILSAHGGDTVHCVTYMYVITHIKIFEWVPTCSDVDSLSSLIISHFLVKGLGWCVKEIERTRTPILSVWNGLTFTVWGGHSLYRWLEWNYSEGRKEPQDVRGWVGVGNVREDSTWRRKKGRGGGGATQPPTLTGFEPRTSLAQWGVAHMGGRAWRPCPPFWQGKLPKNCPRSGGGTSLVDVLKNKRNLLPLRQSLWSYFHRNNAQWAHKPDAIAKTKSGTYFSVAQLPWGT